MWPGGEVCLPSLITGKKWKWLWLKESRAKGEVPALHCNAVSRFFKSRLRAWPQCQFLQSRGIMALVKCQLALRSPVAFAVHILPCFCTKIAEHGHSSATEIDLPSCLILPYIAGARRLWATGPEGQCLPTEPWGRALASGQEVLSHWTHCSQGSLLGFAVIRADLQGVECLRDLNPGQSSWRGCVH